MDESYTFHTIFYPKQPKIQLVFGAISVDVGGRVCYYNNSLIICAAPYRTASMGGKSYERIHLYNQRARWHSRTAGMLAKEAKTCQSTVTIVDKNGKSVDATRLMALMGMGIKCGDTVTVKIEGADEDTAAPALEKFFNEHL